MPTAKKFTDLEVWQLASELQKKTYALIEQPPLSKDFALKDQMNRSSGSITDNIAEGFGRGGRNEFIQFLGYARASASELQSQIIRCYDRKFITKETYIDLHELVDKTGNKIGSFIKYLNTSSIRGEKFKNRKPLENQETFITKDRESNGEIKSTLYNYTANEKRETVEKSETNNKQQTITNTSNAAKPLGAYPHARKVGDLLFLSGIGSRSAKDNSIPGLKLDGEGNILQYDIEAETHQCFANVKAVLEASGSSWDKIIDVTVFLTNMKKDFALYNKIYAEYFTDVQACRTTVEVKSLPTPIAIELKVIAMI